MLLSPQYMFVVSLFGLPFVLNPCRRYLKMKAILRCWKIRSLDLLPDAIQKALSCVLPLDCSHCFAASDYC